MLSIDEKLAENKKIVTIQGIPSSIGLKYYPGESMANQSVINKGYQTAMSGVDKW